MPFPGLGGLIDRYFIKQPRLREAVTRRVYGDGDCEVMLFGQKVAINALRENGYLRAARAARHLSLFRDEAQTLQRLASLCEDGMTFVDVGANVGIFSICMADVGKLRCDFRIVAFEAHPDTFRRLAANAARHGFEAHHAAITTAAGPQRFVAGAVSHVTTTPEHANAYSIAGREFEVAGRRLDSYDLGDRLLLKIDVEGQELAALRGATGLFEAGRVRAVLIDEDDRHREVAAFLQGYGFDLRDARTLEPLTKGLAPILALAANRPGLTAAEVA